MPQNGYSYKQIAGFASVYARAPLAAHRYRLAAVNSGGDVHFDAPVMPDQAKPAAFRTRLVYDLSAARAFWAVSRALHNAERSPLL